MEHNSSSNIISSRSNDNTIQTITKQQNEKRKKKHNRKLVYNDSNVIQCERNDDKCVYCHCVNGLNRENAITSITNPILLLLLFSISNLSLRSVPNSI